MSKRMNHSTYLDFLREVKTRILHSRYHAARLVNREMLLLYFAIGRRLSQKVAAENWGAKVIEQISTDLQKELPGLRGFSYRNLKNMRQFADEYTDLRFLDSSAQESKLVDKQPVKFGQSSTAQFADIEPEIFFSLGFTHHILLINRCKGLGERLFYMQEAAQHQWTVEMLDHQIAARLYHTRGALPNNFTQTLPEQLRDTALLAFKDEYLLDFIHIDPEDERVLEQHIVEHIRHFILTMGRGFAFIGNQYRVLADEEEFFIDLLFYNRLLQCLVAVDLKRGKFKPEHVGKLNFYLNVLNDKLRLPHENPSVGIILCREKNDTIVEYAFRGTENPMGVSVYRISTEMPENLREVLPDEDQLKRLLD